MKIAVTGATGRVGRALVARAINRGHQLRIIARHPLTEAPGVEVVRIGDLNAEPDLQQLFKGCDAVVNLVARAHIVRETEKDPKAAYLRTNTDLAVALAKAAQHSAVRRFVQISSVAAITSFTAPGTVADDAAPACPQTLYGLSKLEADIRLQDEVAALGLSVISLRPPAVFGAGIAGPFMQMVSLARKGIPLPLGSIDNARSFIFVTNLADAIVTACEGEPQGCFVVTDSSPISTANLYRCLLTASCHRPWLPKFPVTPLNAIAAIMLGSRADSLFKSAAFDGARFKDAFQWRAPLSFDAAVNETINGHPSR